MYVRMYVRVRTIAGRAHTVRNRQMAANREISSLPFTLSIRWNPDGRSLLRYKYYGIIMMRRGEMGGEER